MPVVEKTDSFNIVKIRDILQQKLIIPQLKSVTKPELLKEIAHHICKHNDDLATSEKIIFEALLNRERLGSTGVGEGVAIPHAKVMGLSNLVACFGKSSKGIEFDALDSKSVNLVFALLVPENSGGLHLKALARISRLLKNNSFRNRLFEQTEQVSLYQTFLDEDSKL